MDTPIWEIMKAYSEEVEKLRTITTEVARTQRVLNSPETPNTAIQNLLEVFEERMKSEEAKDCFLQGLVVCSVLENSIDVNKNLFLRGRAGTLRKIIDFLGSRGLKLKMKI